jgi:acyl carrier protein
MMIDEKKFLEKLAEVFREELELPSLRLAMDTVRGDLEPWDSLAHVRLVIGVERLFDVQLDVAEIESIASVRDFYDAICRHAG